MCEWVSTFYIHLLVFQAGTLFVSLHNGFVCSFSNMSYVMWRYTNVAHTLSKHALELMKLLRKLQEHQLISFCLSVQLAVTLAQKLHSHKSIDFTAPETNVQMRSSAGCCESDGMSACARELRINENICRQRGINGWFRIFLWKKFSFSPTFTSLKVPLRRK